MIDECAQLQADIDRLREAIEAVDRLPDLPTAHPDLHMQLAEKERRLMQLLGVAVQPVGQLAMQAHGATLLVGDEHARPRRSVLNEYLHNLIHSAQRLSLADADSSDPTRAAVELTSVYVRLEVASTTPLSQDERREHLPGRITRNSNAVEILNRHQHVVLVGDPGSGKSTFLNFVVLCLAHYALGHAGWIEQLGSSWPYGHLLPVRVALHEFGTWLNARSVRPTRGDAALFWLWLKQQYSRGLGELLQAVILRGQAVILFDGLDEISETKGQTLNRVRQTIESLRMAAPQSRMIVTCRYLDYTQPSRQLPQWQVERLIPFSNDLVQEFIQRWYDVLTSLDRPMNGDPHTLRNRLRMEVRQRPALRQLAGNPLLLTMITLLHAYEGRLPEERVRVYEKCVEFLLYRWRAPLGEQPLRERLDLPQWSESDLNRILDRIGFVAHSRGFVGDGESGADLPRHVLIETARSFFAPYDEARALARAEAFCSYISRYSNGIIQQSGPDTYRFPHRTFQEFLASRRLTGEGDWEGEEAEFVDRVARRASAEWREALLLAVSRLVVVAEQIRPSADVVEALIDRFPTNSPEWAQDVILCGEILAEVGRERLMRLGTRRLGLWERVTQALLHLIGYVDPTGRTLVPLADRVRAGMALGLMGDPRLPVSAGQWQSALTLRSYEYGKPHLAGLHPQQMLEHYFCYVPAGRYQIGGWSTRQLAQTEPIQPFWIARFPVTVGQFAPFVQVGYGPSGRRWWTPDGWQWKDQNTQPWLWDRSDYNGANQPIVGVTWYEAIAFAAWLNEQLHAVLPPGYQVRLPSEAEWEVAAAYDANGQRHPYPWGDTRPTVEHAISVVSRLERSAPVGICPLGSAASGAMDMAGNVWEWTMHTVNVSPRWDAQILAQLDPRDRVVLMANPVPLRGGSYRMDPRSVSSSARSLFHPGSDLDFGFRLVVAPRRDEIGWVL